jgi:nicotinamide riboside transporter PnuC
MARRVAIAALLITGIVNTLHYARLIVRGYPVAPGHPEAYRDLAQAATWADGWMGLMAIAAAVGLIRGRPWGWLCGIVAAAALIHMGLLDVAFFAQHRMYARIDPLMAEMITVDLWAFFMGSFLVVHLWREQTREMTRSTQS